MYAPTFRVAFGSVTLARELSSGIGVKRISVVVPAYNEASRIARVLETMPENVEQVVVVDDASTDATGEVVRACMSKDARVRYLRQPVNAGVGRAIVRGYQELLCAKVKEGAHGGGTDSDCGRGIFVVMAGDGQMNPDDLSRLVAPIETDQADYVKGERFSHAEIRTRMPKERYWAGRVLSRLTGFATGYDITDSQCGYTAITSEACRSLDLDALWPKYGYPNDLLGQLAVRGLRVAQVPVEPVYTKELESKLRAHHVPGVMFVIARSYVRRLTRR
jgi:glycosyltransferase involved in cell wall biosynthesis